MPDSIKVIEALPEHVDQVVELWIELMEYHRPYDNYYTPRPEAPDNFRKFLETLIKEDFSTLIVALTNDKVIGYTIGRIEDLPPVFIEEKHGMIYDMAVTESFRRQGAGELMMKFAKEWFQSKKLKLVTLHVDVHNPIGNAFWRKQGFEPLQYIMKMNL